MNAILLIDVKEQGLFTFEAYSELRLQMSTGDFHTHKTKFVNCESSVEYTDFDSEMGEFFVVNEVG